MGDSVSWENHADYYIRVGFGDRRLYAGTRRRFQSAGFRRQNEDNVEAQVKNVVRIVHRLRCYDRGLSVSCLFPYFAPGLLSFLGGWTNGTMASGSIRRFGLKVRSCTFWPMSFAIPTISCVA